MIRPAAFALAVALAGTAAPAAAQQTEPVPGTMAVQPDPADFIGRADTGLIVQGNPLRFGGMNIPWLGLVQTQEAVPRFATHYEVRDILATVQAMASGYIRVASLGITAGCQTCLVPSPRHINQAALDHLDMVLKLARDAGIKIIVPLAGAGGDCASGTPDPVAGTACIFAKSRGRSPAEFYTDPTVRADFAAAITAMLNHLNPLTGLMVKDDATIMAWENCDGCGAGADPQTLADWTEFLGRTIKQTDTRHLYENGAFAGRLANIPQPLLALPSVDILGDRTIPGTDADGAGVSASVRAVVKSGHAYVLDAYGWTPAQWPSADAFENFMIGLAKNRQITGAFLSDLSGHADGGGYLASPAHDPALYFPGVATQSADLAAMQARSRAVRRFSYRMIGLLVQPFSNVEQPEIIAADGGQLTWRGAAGALDYSIARSPDVSANGSWRTLCDRCVTDADPHWRDPAPAQGAGWYRITPYNANGHSGMPSEPVRNSPQH